MILMRAGKIFLAFFVIATGCSYSRVSESTHPTSNRKYAPEPIYSRVTMARPPETHPASVSIQKGDAKFFQILHFQIRNQSLEETAKLLAGTSRYHSYCAASIADQKITIDTIGTIDEIGEKIAAQMGIDVTIDHVNKEVRFLRKV